MLLYGVFCFLFCFVFAVLGVSCSIQTSVVAECEFLSSSCTGVPECTGSIVVARRLSCPTACEIFISPTRNQSCVSYSGRWTLNH